MENARSELRVCAGSNCLELSSALKTIRFYRAPSHRKIKNDVVSESTRTEETEMKYRVVPFVANIQKGEGPQNAAAQLQGLDR